MRHRFAATLLALSAPATALGGAMQDEPPASAPAPQDAPAASAPATPSTGGARPRGATPMFSKKVRDDVYKKVKELLDLREKLATAKEMGDVGQIKQADSKAKKTEAELNSKLKNTAKDLKLGVDEQCLSAAADWQGMLSDYLTEKRSYSASGKTLGAVKEVETRDAKKPPALYVPKKYDTKTSWPLLLVVQDRASGKLPKHAFQEVLKSAALLDGDGLPSGTIVLVTAMSESDEPQDLIASAVRPLREVRQIYRVDPNRIAIGGIGDGAAGAATVASLAPHIFSAFVAFGGSPGAAKPQNFSNLPVLVLGKTAGWDEWAKTASAAGANVRTMEGAGVEALAPWLAERVRDPYARHVSYSPTAYGRRGTVWIDAEPEPTKEAKVDARVDAESNRITIEADAVTRIRLLLSDALLDLSKPVTITINGDRPFEGKLPPSMSTLYQCLDEAGGLDPGAIYTVTHTVSVRPKRSTKDATPASGSGNGGSGSEKK